MRCSNPSTLQAGFSRPYGALRSGKAPKGAPMKWHERENAEASKRSLNKQEALREKIAQMKADAEKKKKAEPTKAE
ncbi:MAG: hypothetical protein EBY23_10825 [Actinobacteria bacterium]|nr:hypothetical protein [Actinomycetota bacterium]